MSFIYYSICLTGITFYLYNSPMNEHKSLEYPPNIHVIVNHCLSQVLWINFLLWSFLLLLLFYYDLLQVLITNFLSMILMFFFIITINYIYVTRLFSRGFTNQIGFAELLIWGWSESKHKASSTILLKPLIF